MCPPSTVIATLRTTSSGAGVTDWIYNGDSMFSVTEEDVVIVVEAMIDSHLKAVGVVRRGPALDKILGEVSGQGKIRRGRILPEELLHRSEDQCRRNFIARCADGLVLLFLRVDG